MPELRFWGIKEWPGLFLSEPGFLGLKDGSDSNHSSDSNHKHPVQQKQRREYHAGNTICGHKGKIHPAKVVRFYQQMLINEHGAEKYDACIIQYAHLHIHSRQNDQYSRKHMQKRG